MEVILIILLFICLSYHCKGFYYDEDAELLKEERRERERREWIKLGLMEEPTDEERLKFESKKRKKKAQMKMLNAVHARVGKEDGIFQIDKRESKRHISRSVMMTATLTKDFIEVNKNEDKSHLTWDQVADKCDEWMYRINFVVKEVVCYPEESTGSILIVVINDWEAEDVWKFLERQKDIQELTWDRKTVHPYSTN